MGILANILGADNPVAKWTLQNQNLLSNWGAGLGAGRTFGEGLGMAAQMGPQGIAADQQVARDEAEKAERQQAINQSAKDLAKFPDLMQAVASKAITPAQAYDEAFRRSAPGYGASASDPTGSYDGRLRIGQEQGLTGDDLATYALTGNLPTGRGASGEMALTPTWLWDEKTQQYVPGQMDKTGKVNVTTIPEGYTAADPFQMAGGKVAAQGDAKTAAAARAALPGAQQALTIAQKAIALVRDDVAGLNEQFGNTWGVPNRNLPTVPGVFQQSKGNWQANFSQAKGQGFMQAREMLKGGGPITDFEGMKGEAAFSRMEQAVAIGDKDTFLLALKDFEEAVADGYAKLEATAKGAYSEGGPGITDLGNGITIRELP